MGPRASGSVILIYLWPLKYGSLTLGYRVKICNIILVPTQLINCPFKATDLLHQRIGRLWWDVWHYLIHGSGSQGHGRYCRRFSSDLFLVVIHRFRNCGLILNWRGYWIYRYSICYSWLGLWFWICPLSRGGRWRLCSLSSRCSLGISATCEVNCASIRAISAS